jgi:glycosyltransferase involved in cell wall biosynthesis
MTIAIDCRMLDASGIGVYLRGILPWLLRSPHRFLLLGDTEKLRPLAVNADNAVIIGCGIKIFSPRELFFFPKNVLQKINEADLFYSPFFNIPGGIAVPVYTTIHDIIFPDMPGLTSPAGLFIRMRFFKRAVQKSRKIFTVSQFSKSRIEHYLGTAKPVIVIHSAIQNAFLAYNAENPKIEKNETIVFIGNIKKHKGLDCLLGAFSLARAEGLPHRLTIIGGRDNFRTADNAFLRKIDSLGPDAVAFTGFISDTGLMEQLSRAALLVQPSLYEGFGLPPLEAMALGTQALVSDIPVLREIYAGFPVRFFRAGDIIDLKNKMMEMLFNKKPASLVLPKELLSRYTFEKTAGAVLRELA